MPPEYSTPFRLRYRVNIPHVKSVRVSHRTPYGSPDGRISCAGSPRTARSGSSSPDPAAVLPPLRPPRSWAVAPADPRHTFPTYHSPRRPSTISNFCITTAPRVKLWHESQGLPEQVTHKIGRVSGRVKHFPQMPMRQAVTYKPLCHNNLHNCPFSVRYTVLTPAQHCENARIRVEKARSGAAFRISATQFRSGARTPEIPKNRRIRGSVCVHFRVA